MGVPEGHPAFGEDYDGLNCDVHGGLTFAGECSDYHGEHGICHVPEQGRPERVWWLGFDCMHAGDISPEHAALGIPVMGSMGIYRTLAYVRAECGSLAQQLGAA